MARVKSRQLAADALAKVRDTGFLRRLPPELQEEVLKEAQLIEFPAGAVSIYRDDSRRPALVVWGLIRNYLSWGEDRQLTLAYHRPGDLFEVLGAGGEVVSDGIQAVEASGVLNLDHGALDRLAKTRSELAMALADDLRDRLGLAYRALALQTFGTVRQRVAADLLERAAGSATLRTGEELDVTAQQLADATGSVREVVGRILKQLRLEGVLRTESNHVVVLDPVALRREAGTD